MKHIIWKYKDGNRDYWHVNAWMQRSRKTHKTWHIKIELQQTAGAAWNTIFEDCFQGQHEEAPRIDEIMCMWSAAVTSTAIGMAKYCKPES